MRDGLKKMKLNSMINLTEEDFDELSESGSDFVSYFNSLLALVE
jgi:hypothetical protein